jgi:hypothetical protein
MNEPKKEKNSKKSYVFPIAILAVFGLNIWILI